MDYTSDVAARTDRLVNDAYLRKAYVQCTIEVLVASVRAALKADKAHWLLSQLQEVSADLAGGSTTRL